ncbi:MAG TPA: hypothetical protein VF009_06915 [Solirubrobacterales bacterium]
MAASTSIKVKPKVVNTKRCVAEVTLDNAYALNGEPIKPSEFGLRVINDAVFFIKNGTESEALPIASAYYDSAKGTIRVVNAKTQKEVAEGADLSKVVLIAVVNGS